MIVWGSKNKEKKIGSVPFFCPTCQREGTATHAKLARYFTLYFIPIFPMQTFGEFVRCDACHATFETSILNVSRADILAATQPWLCARCQNRNPAGSDECLGCGTHRDGTKLTSDFDL